MTAKATSNSVVGGLSMLIDDFERHLAAANKAPRTIGIYGEAGRLLDSYLRAQGMPTEVARIDREHVEAFTSDQLSRYRPATASQRYRALAQLFEWLAEEGEIPLCQQLAMSARPQLQAVGAPVGWSVGDYHPALQAVDKDDLNGIGRSALLGGRAVVDGRYGEDPVADMAGEAPPAPGAAGTVTADGAGRPGCGCCGPSGQRLRRRVTGEELDDLLADPGQVGAEAEEDLDGDTLTLADETEEEVLGADVVVAELQRLAQRQVENLLGPRRERRRRAGRPPGRPTRLLHLRPDPFDVDAEELQRPGGDTFALFEKPEQEMLRTNELVVEGFTLGQDHHPSASIRETLEHANSLRHPRYRAVTLCPPGPGAPASPHHGQWPSL
jgi:hypothetical protein